MENQISRKQQNVFLIILVAAFLLPVAFFGVIKALQLNGLILYFSQLGLYALFFILALWGLKKEKISTALNWKKVLAALILTALAWLAYALICCAIAKVRLADALAPLGTIPAWKIGANILSTWIFVGIVEEILFRGYFLTKIKHYFEKKNIKLVTLLAILVSSLLFSIWHLPVRIFEMINGQSSVALIALSLMILFMLGIAFAWLYIRTQNILLVGLVHGLMDFPLIGQESQLSFTILIAAILLVEVVQMMNRKNADLPDEEDF